MAFPYDDPTEDEPVVDKMAANTNECKDKNNRQDKDIYLEANTSDKSNNPPWNMYGMSTSESRREETIIQMPIEDRTQNECNPNGCWCIFWTCIAYFVISAICLNLPWRAGFKYR